MEITGIQIKSMQNAQRNYDAIILKFGDMHFTRDLLQGAGADRDIRRAKQLALHHLHALGPTGSAPFFAPPRHKYVIPENVSLKLKLAHDREALRINHDE